MKCPTCNAITVYGVCPDCHEAIYLRDEREAIQAEPYWEAGIYQKGET